MKRVMLDIETLGTAPGSVITSIGAVAFDEEDSNYFLSFHKRINPQSCVDLGMHMETGTVLWWMQQEEAARAEFAKTSELIVDVLNEFSRWYVTSGAAEVWGNGATFDNVLLSEAYRLAKIKRPWSYRADRCYRTLANLYPEIQLERTGVLHNPVDDATTQANHLVKILKAMRK